MIILLVSSVLYRLDGWGKDDRFLPFLKWPQWGGVNYTRYLIGVFIWAVTMNPIYILTYAIAVSFPYGENSFLRKLGNNFCWAFVGFVFGLASLSWGNAVFCGALFWFLMSWSNNQTLASENRLNHSWVEFLFGGLGTLIHLWK